MRTLHPPPRNISVFTCLGFSAPLPAAPCLHRRRFGCFHRSRCRYRCFQPAAQKKKTRWELRLTGGSRPAAGAFPLAALTNHQRYSSLGGPARAHMHVFLRGRGGGGHELSPDNTNRSACASLLQEFSVTTERQGARAFCVCVRAVPLLLPSFLC